MAYNYYPMILKPGTIDCIMNNNRENPIYHAPVLQLISIKRISLGDNKGFRYHVILSDSQYYIKGIFSSACTSHFEKKLITNFSLVKAASFRVCEKNNTSFLYISAIEEFEDTPRKIGSPVKWGDADSSYFESPKINAEPASPPPVKVEDNITPIITLNPFLNKWTISGTITAKSDIKYFTNQRGEGKLFNAEIADHSGSIRLIAFNDVVDIFYKLLEVGRVYAVTRAGIRMGNKKFSSTTSEYEITLEKNSEVRMVAEASTSEPIFNFTSIGSITTPQSLVDVIGVVKDAYPPNTVIVRSTQKEVTKRDVVICDSTGTIRLTLWGTNSELELDDNPVIAVKNVRVGEYRGPVISTISSSQVFVNPERKEAFELKGWFLQHGSEIKLPKREEKLSTIAEIIENNMEYSTVKAVLLFIREENLWYDACVGDGCSKKVFLENGGYRCERCNRTYDECDTRFLVRASIGDHTGQIWVTIFDEAAKKLFEITAAELKILQQEGSEGVMKKFLFKEKIFRLRKREEIYNDEARARFTVIDISPVDIEKEVSRMITEIKRVSVVFG